MSIVSILLIALNLILGALFIRFLSLGKANKKVLGGVAIFLVLLFSYLLMTVPSGSQLPASTDGLMYFVYILIGVALYGTLILLTPIKTALRNLSDEYLIIPQGLRALFGALFIVGVALGDMPAGAGFFHGGMHVMTGVLSLLAAIMYMKNYYGRTAIFIASLFGLIDVLTTAFDLAFLNFDTIGLVNSINYAVFFAAPLYLWLHLLSLARVIKSSNK